MMGGPAAARALGVKYDFVELVKAINRYRNQVGRHGRYTGF